MLIQISSFSFQMVPLKTVLFLVAFVSLLCFVTGGHYGGRNSGYGSGSGGYSVYPMSVIYPALSHTHSSSLPYQSSLYSYNSPSLSYPTTYAQYYPSHYHSYQPYPLNPLIYTNNDVGYGSGGLFSNGVIPILVMCKYHGVYFILVFRGA